MESVGVVIPALNAARFIDQSLASVAGQTLRPDAVVVVDDGSTDATTESASRWGDLLPLRVVRNPGTLGSALSRAVAIKQLDTDLIALLDADDLWLPDHLQLMTAGWREHGGLVTGQALRWVPGAALSSGASSTSLPPRERQLERMILQNYVGTFVLFDRVLYDQAGGFREFVGAEDWDLWLRMLSAGAGVSMVESPTTLHRLRVDSKSANRAFSLRNEIAVLEAFLAETSDAHLQDVARRALRLRHAHLALLESYQDARRGDRARARTAALRGLRGTWPVALRSAAMLVAPGRSVGVRERLRTDARRAVGG